MNDINFRIKSLIDIFCKGNNSAFARKVGAKENNIRHYLNGTEPKFSFLKKLTEELDINPEWLLTGKGDMLKEKNDSSLEVQEDSEHESRSLEDNLNIILNKINDLEKHVESIDGYVYGSLSLNKQYFRIICSHIGIELNEDEYNITKYTEVNTDIKQDL